MDIFYCPHGVVDVVVVVVVVLVVVLILKAVEFNNKIKLPGKIDVYGKGDSALLILKTLKSFTLDNDFTSGISFAFAQFS